MKVTIENVAVETRDGLICLDGIAEVLVRGSEVLLLPVGVEYVPAAEPEPSDHVEKQEMPEEMPSPEPEPAPEPEPGAAPAPAISSSRWTERPPSGVTGGGARKDHG